MAGLEILGPYGDGTYNLLLTDAAVTVGVGLVSVLGINAGAGAPVKLVLRNSSLGAQNIRVGGTPSFTVGAEAGVLLRPLEAVILILEGINLANVPLQAIADGAGAVLDRLVFYKNSP